jgi:uncharacterized protein involved in exopolysaccharide biosynthesis
MDKQPEESLGSESSKSTAVSGDRVVYVVSPESMAGSEIDTIDLLTLFRTLRNEWRLIAAVTLALAVLAAVVALLITPVYRASVLLAPVDHDSSGMGVASLPGQLGGLAGLAGISMKGGNSAATTIATLKSRKFLVGLVREKNLKSLLFPDRWDSDAAAWIVEEPGIIDLVKSWLLPEKIGTAASEKLLPGEPSTNETYSLLIDEVLSVEQDASNSLITLSIDWTDPLVAATWANAVVANVNKELRDRAIRDSERSIAYLTQQVSQTDISELRSSLFRLIEDQTKNMTVARTQEDYALQVIDPAVAPDLTDRLRPRRGLIVGIGLVVGVFLGALAAFLKAGFRKARQALSS